jgi:uncharacterized metal-binding protein YceD (DUF177 family)
MTPDRPLKRPTPVASLPKTGQMIAFDASEAERAAVAAFLDLPSVERLAAELTLRPARGGVHVEGRVRAGLHQTCVATLDPFPVAIDEPVDVRFAPPEALGPISGKEIERRLDDEDPPEPLEGGAVDLGALAVETIALALDPYPRKPGAPPADVSIGDPVESPFAALAALKTPPER